MSRILGISPFDPTLLAHNESQLDFILVMYTRDNPRGPVRIERRDKSLTNAEAAWADVLTGKDLDEYLGVNLPPPAVMETLRRISRGFANEPDPASTPTMPPRNPG